MPAYDAPCTRRSNTSSEPISPPFSMISRPSSAASSLCTRHNEVPAPIAGAAISGLRQIYKPGYRLAKAGVMLLDLQDSSVEQSELDLDDPGPDRGNAHGLFFPRLWDLTWLLLVLTAVRLA